MNTTTLFKSLPVLQIMLCASLVITVPAVVQAQAVTDVITDYNGFWKSSSKAKNPVKPDDSHNLLSFSYNGVSYSTGVKDNVLKANGETFVAGEYRALPMQNLTGTATGNTKIGKGAKSDGVSNGRGTAPSRSLGQYLNDGINGLDIGTSVANLPKGSMYMSVSDLKAAKIGDGVPDILVTQVADPSSTADSYEFTDIDGVRIGNVMQVTLNNIAPVGDWTADFYEATGSTILQAGFTETSRPMRLWAADFSAFGIDSSNINRITYFKVNLSGESDIAFVAYNTTTITMQAILSINDTPDRERIMRSNPENRESFSVFPNPSRGAITINHEKVGSNFTLNIYNQSGVLVTTSNRSARESKTALNLSHLPKGAYYAVLTSDMKKTARPFLIQ